MYQYLENISGNIFQHSNNVNSHLMVNFISQHLLLTTNNSLKPLAYFLQMCCKSLL